MPVWLAVILFIVGMVAGILLTRIYKRTRDRLFLLCAIAGFIIAAAYLIYLAMTLLLLGGIT